MGATYALDPERRTLLLASYSRFAGQLDAFIVGYENPRLNQNRSPRILRVGLQARVLAKLRLRTDEKICHCRVAPLR
jgi:hypothetical protein